VGKEAVSLDTENSVQSKVCFRCSKNEGTEPWTIILLRRDSTMQQMFTKRTPHMEYVFVCKTCKNELEKYNRLKINIALVSIVISPIIGYLIYKLFLQGSPGMEWWIPPLFGLIVGSILVMGIGWFIIDMVYHCF